jgi:ribosomal protein S18 acetylase RimI-like enzyme
MTEAKQNGTERAPSQQDRDPLVVRRASPVDAHAIARINVLCWQTAYRSFLPEDFLAGLSVEPRAAAWATLLDSEAGDDGPAWVAVSDGRVVGYLSSGPPRDDGAPHGAAEVYSLYVLPEEWRSGAGRALLEAAVARWVERDTTTLLLWVFEANSAARAFYEAMNWRPDGTHREIDLDGFSVREVRYLLATARTESA